MWILKRCIYVQTASASKETLFYWLKTGSIVLFERIYYSTIIIVYLQKKRLGFPSHYMHSRWVGHTRPTFNADRQRSLPSSCRVAVNVSLDAAPIPATTTIQPMAIGRATVTFSLWAPFVRHVECNISNLRFMSLRINFTSTTIFKFMP